MKTADTRNEQHGVPQSFPVVTRAQIESLCGESFAGRVASILSLFLPETETLSARTEEAYRCFDGDPAPLVKVDDGLFFSELWHGPTLCYRDLAFTAADDDGFLRIVPLIACYFSAYADLLDAGEIACGDEVNFCVPYGDGSCLAAGQCAYRMGLPVGKLLCATGEDENPDFSGVDVPREKITVFRASEEDVLDAICYAFDEYGYLLDPHSAAALFAMEEYAARAVDDFVTVVFAVASPHLFASEVLSAIGEKSTGNLRRDCLLLEEVTACEAPEALIKNPEKAKLFTGMGTDALRSFASKTGKKG